MRHVLIGFLAVVVAIWSVVWFSQGRAERVEVRPRGWVEVVEARVFQSQDVTLFRVYGVPREPTYVLVMTNANGVAAVQLK